MSERNHALIEELKHEAASTRRMFEKISSETFAFKPHEKSTGKGKLVGHIAQLFGYPALMLQTEKLDFAAGTYVPFVPQSREEALARLDEEVAKSIAALQKAEPEDMAAPWTMCSGAHIIATLPKAVFMRSAALNHLIHHRGQLSVYLRLNNEHVPGMYGPSADEH